MQLRNLLLSLVAATTCSAAALTRPAMCGNPAPSKEYREVLAKAAAAEQPTHISAKTKQASRTVRTYVHIIASDQSRSGGNIAVRI